MGHAFPFVGLRTQIPHRQFFKHLHIAWRTTWLYSEAYSTSDVFDGKTQSSELMAMVQKIQKSSSLTTRHYGTEQLGVLKDGVLLKCVYVCTACSYFFCDEVFLFSL